MPDERCGAVKSLTRGGEARTREPKIQPAPEPSWLFQVEISTERMPEKSCSSTRPVRSRDFDFVHVGTLWIHLNKNIRPLPFNPWISNAPHSSDYANRVAHAIWPCRLSIYRAGGI